jgi:hypothetical protein
MSKKPRLEVIQGEAKPRSLIQEALAAAANPLPPKLRSKKLRAKKPKGRYVTMYGPGDLSAYLVQRRATMAMPLLLAIQRRFDLTKKRRKDERIALTPAVWKDAGNPPHTMRKTMLGHLRRMPDLALLVEERNLAFRYRVEKGPAWRAIEKTAREAKDENGGEIE